MKLARNLAWLFASEGISRLVQFVAIAYLARTLGASGLGTLNWVLSISLMVAVIPNLGLSEYGILRISRDPSSHNVTRVTRDVVSARIALGSLAIAGLVLMTFWIPLFAEYRSLFVAACVLQLSTVLMFDWLYTALEHQAVVGVGRLIARVGYLAAVLLVVHTSDDVLLALLASVGSELALAVGLFAYSFRVSPRGFALSTPGRIRVVLKDAWPLAVYVANATVMNQVDLSILGTLLPMHETGLYAGGLRIVGLFVGVKLLVGQLVYPKLARRPPDLQQSDDLTTLVSILNRYSLMAGMTIVLALTVFSREIVVLALGSEFGSGWWVFALLSVALFVEFGWMVFPYLVISINPKAYTTITVVTGVAKVLSLLLVVPAAGLVGAALIYGLAKVAVFALSIGYVRRRVHVLSNTKLVVIPLAFLTTALGFAYYLDGTASRVGLWAILLGLAMIYLRSIGQGFSWSGLKSDFVAVNAY